MGQLDIPTALVTSIHAGSTAGMGWQEDTLTAQLLSLDHSHRRSAVV